MVITVICALLIRHFKKSEIFKEGINKIPEDKTSFEIWELKNNKLKMILPEEEAIKYDVGNNIKITIDTSKAYLFTSDTGVNINKN